MWTPYGWRCNGEENTAPDAGHDPGYVQWFVRLRAFPQGSILPGATPTEGEHEV